MPGVPSSFLFPSEKRGHSPKGEAPAGVWIDRGPALPAGYGRDAIRAMARDPHCVFAWWELEGGLLDRWRRDRPGVVGLGRWTARARSPRGDVLRQAPADPVARRVYLDGLPEDADVEVEIGLLDAADVFHPLLRSNPVRTPRGRVSDLVDPEWVPTEAEAEELRRRVGIMGESAGSYPGAQGSGNR